MGTAFPRAPRGDDFQQDPPQIVSPWGVEGVDDMATAYAMLVATSPISKTSPVGILYRTNVSVADTGGGTWDGRVTYGRIKKDAGQFGFGFNTGGATVHIKCAREHVADYNHPDNPFPVANYKGAIGVNKAREIEGTEIVSKALRLTYTYKHPQGVVDELYAKQLASITGCTNSATFRTFSPGELLFVGADGQDGTDAEAAVSFELLASSNESELTIGEIADIVKKGHDYVWIEFADDDDSGIPIVKPIAAHVERVYDEVPFAAYFGWE